MKQMNDIERRLLSLMVQDVGKYPIGISLVDLLDSEIENAGYCVRDGEVLVHVAGKVLDEQMLSRVLALTYTLHQALNLISYLDEYGLIIAHNPDNTGKNQDEEVQFSRIADGEDKVSYSIKDSNLCDQLTKYGQLRFYVGQEVIDYVKRGFVSLEDERHRETISWAVCGLVFNGIVTIVSCVLQLMSIYQECKSEHASDIAVSEQSKFTSALLNASQEHRRIADHSVQVLESIYQQLGDIRTIGDSTLILLVRQDQRNKASTSRSLKY